jgi:hypothetical protein
MSVFDAVPPCAEICGYRDRTLWSRVLPKSALPAVCPTTVRARTISQVSKASTGRSGQELPFVAANHCDASARHGTEANDPSVALRSVPTEVPVPRDDYGHEVLEAELAITKQLEVGGQIKITRPTRSDRMCVPLAYPDALVSAKSILCKRLRMLEISVELATAPKCAGTRRASN